jgi:hypothetical protein
MYPALIRDQLEPRTVAFSQHTEHFDQLEVLHQLGTAGVREAFQHIFINNRLACIGVESRLPTETKEPFGYLFAGRGIERDGVDFGEGNTFDISTGLVVDLGDEYFLLDFGRELSLKVSNKFVSSRCQPCIELDGFRLIEENTCALLLEDDLLKIMFQSESFRGIVLIEDMLIELCQDLNVLFAVGLHFRRPFVPSVLRYMSVITFMFPKSISPCRETVRPDKVFRERV